MSGTGVDEAIVVNLAVDGGGERWVRTFSGRKVLTFVTTPR
jgi:hypothetical protein